MSAMRGGFMRAARGRARWCCESRPERVGSAVSVSYKDTLGGPRLPSPGSQPGTRNLPSPASQPGTQELPSPRSQGATRRGPLA